MSEEIKKKWNEITVSEIETMAEAFAASGFYDGIKNKHQAMALMFIAQSEGKHPASGIKDYSIIQGKPSKKAEAMLRDFIEAGGKVDGWKLSDTSVSANFSHPSGGSLTINWDMERAKKAGLSGRVNYIKYPRQMLRSRVVSEGIRTVCPMATSGMYVPEEVQDFDEPKPTKAPEKPKEPENPFDDDIPDFPTPKTEEAITDKPSEIIEIQSELRDLIGQIKKKKPELSENFILRDLILEQKAEMKHIGAMTKPKHVQKIREGVKRAKSWLEELEEKKAS